jgi:hypothetical protein
MIVKVYAQVMLLEYLGMKHIEQMIILQCASSL